MGIKSSKSTDRTFNDFIANDEGKLGPTKVAMTEKKDLKSQSLSFNVCNNDLTIANIFCSVFFLF